MAALVVGLGNPGPEYSGTRHNVGQLVVVELARRGGVALAAHKAHARVGTIRLAGAEGAPGPGVVLGIPLTFMNISGGPVAALAKYYSVEARDVIVVHDDIDLPLGTVKMKRGGGEGGHNGLRDITKALGTKDYVRVRGGVGRPPGHMDAADYVLRPFAAKERADAQWMVGVAADAVEAIVLIGLEAAQQRFHSVD
jgi:PTH1 family peptidyl-tRNA hydrolase